MEMQDLLIRMLAMNHEDPNMSYPFSIMSALRGPDINNAQGCAIFPYDTRMFKIEGPKDMFFPGSGPGISREVALLKRYTTGRLRAIVGLKSTGMVITMEPLTDDEIHLRNVLLHRANVHFKSHFMTGMASAKGLGFDVPQGELTGFIVDAKASKYKRDLIFLEDYERKISRR